MKKQNITLALFGCTLLSTSFVASQMDKVSYQKPHKEISRSIAQVLMNTQVSDTKTKITNDLELYMSNLGSIQKIPTPRQSSTILNSIIEEINAGNGNSIELINAIQTGASQIDELMSSRADAIKRLSEKSADVEELIEIAKRLERDKTQQSETIKGLGKQVDSLNKENSKLNEELAKVKKQETEINSQNDESIEMLSKLVEELSVEASDYKEKFENGKADIELLSELLHKQGDVTAGLLKEIENLKAAKNVLEGAVISLAEHEKVKAELDTVTCQKNFFENQYNELAKKVASIDLAAKKAQNAAEEAKEELAKKTEKAESQSDKVADNSDESDSDDDDKEKVTDIDRISTRDLLMVIHGRYKEDFITNAMMRNLYGQRMGTEAFNSMPMYMEPMQRHDTMLGYMDYMRRQDREFEMTRDFNDRRFRNIERSALGQDYFGVRGTTPSLNDIRNGFNSQFIRGQRTLIAPRDSYNPSHYDFMERGYDFNTQDILSTPTYGTRELLADPIILS